MNKVVAPILFCWLSCFTLLAQGKLSPKLHAKMNQASQLMVMRQFDQAEKITSKVLKKAPSHTEAYWLMADIFEYRRDDANRLLWLEKACRTDYPHYWHSRFKLAWAQMEAGKYAPALEGFKSLVPQLKKRRSFAPYVRKGITNCEFAVAAMKNPVDYSPVHLGDLNTPFDDYWPSLRGDEQEMVFTVNVGRIPGYTTSVHTHEDFFISKKTANGWSPSVNMGPPLNTEGNEGAQSLSADGTIMFFSACSKLDGYGSCDIYYSRKRNGQWITPINCSQPVNTRFWDSHPSLSPDGRQLFFVSERQGGLGGRDIWVADIEERYDGSLEFSNVHNLGKTINTAEDEISPFIHQDNTTLYFSSNGHPGMGRQDIFMAQRDINCSWGKPTNLGFPINTNQNETGFVVGASGQTGYFASDGLVEGKRDKDIFSLDLSEAIRPLPTTYFKGYVYDKKTNQPLAANFELLDIDADKVLVKRKAGADGKLLLSLPLGKRYGINVRHKGYLFYTDHFDLMADSSMLAYEKRVPLDKLVAGSKVILKNLFFQFGTDELTQASLPELERLYQFVKNNEKIRIELGGHTDNVGEVAYNKALSQKRAEAVKAYLISKGIAADRLRAVGYGERVPLAPNDTETGRASNRRTELKIIE